MTTFYNADRSASATVQLDTYGDFHSFCFDEALARSCDVLLATDQLQGFFDDDIYASVTVSSERSINKAIGQARRAGNRVFFVEICDQLEQTVRIQQSSQSLCRFDSRFEGVIIVRAKDWKEYVGPDFSSAFVEVKMDEAAQWATAWLKLEIYEILTDERVLGPFLTEKDALQTLHSDLPDLTFTDENFDCKSDGSFMLKPEAKALLKVA